MSGNTVFIVGAGASKEAKLRIGVESKNHMAQLLDIRYDNFGDKQEHGDYLIASALFEHVRQPDGRRGNINPYLVEAWHIRDALPQAISIDDFLHAHRDNDKIVLCGKLAIVRSILEDERNSLLYYEPSRDSKLNFRVLEAIWYGSFFKLLIGSCGKNDIKERFKSITLIIFNYDRCVEYFIFHALQNYYRLTEGEVIELVKNIDIYHPYGAVGTLPWLDQNGAMEFGAKPNPKQLLELSQKIKTFTEGTEPGSSEILEIRKHMHIANRVVFLGFAFHELNMSLIAPRKVDDTGNQKIECFATTFGISDSDKAIVNGQIRKLYLGVPIELQMVDLTCADFFEEYRRSLSF